MAQLAYSYTTQIVAPARSLPGLFARHEKACQDAGPSLCQVTGASIDQTDDDQAQGRLTIQAAPSWITGFRKRLSEDAKAANGRISESNTTTEDLTRQIVDTEAAVRAKTALRDRLQTILATRPGKLSDLLEVERELARVQGELDATQSELATAKARVATSTLTIDYRTPTALIPHGAWAPLAAAAREASGVLAGSLGAMLTLAVVIGPWAILIAAIAWLVAASNRRRPAARRSAPPPEPNTPAP